MKLDLRYPFLTSGIPKRNSRLRDLYMSISMAVDVPEVSRRETDIAFMSYETCSLNYHSGAYVHGRWIEKDLEVLKHPGGIDLRTYNGRLYRLIAEHQDELFDTREAFGLGRAFPHVIGANDLDYGVSISFPGTGTSNPLSAALTRQWDWELERASVTDGRVVNAWPGIVRGQNRHATREATDFHDIMSDISQLDDRATQRSLDMIERQSQRLLMIEGQIWMDCRPPCLVVDVDDRGDEICVGLSISHAPDGLDCKLSRRYFDLQDIDAARDYIAQCCKKPKQERLGFSSYEALPDYEAIDPEFARYDADGEELSRIGYALASECTRFRQRTHKWIDANKADSLESAINVVNETNYVTEEFADVAPYVDDLCDTWNFLERPSTFCEIGPASSRKRFGDMMIKRAHELVENAPIDLSGTHFLGAAADTPKF